MCGVVLSRSRQAFQHARWKASRSGALRCWTKRRATTFDRRVPGRSRLKFASSISIHENCGRGGEAWIWSRAAVARSRPAARRGRSLSSWDGRRRPPRSRRVLEPDPAVTLGAPREADDQRWGDVVELVPDRRGSGSMVLATDAFRSHAGTPLRTMTAVGCSDDPLHHSHAGG